MPGRPSGYSQEIADKICSQLSKGMSLRAICKQDGIPSIDTVLRWALDGNHPFCEQYARARRIQAELFIDEVRGISDENENDTYIDEFGKERTNHDVIARAKLKVDTRKWIACKVLPKIYGDKLQTEHSGSISLESLVTESISPLKQKDETSGSED